MVAKIYPAGHPDVEGRLHPVRYFDIRPLSPRECYRLMGVPPRHADVLMQRDASGKRLLSNSAHYVLAGNSIVCDVLVHIYESLIYPDSEYCGGMFSIPRFRLPLPSAHPLRIVTLCSGYDSQCIAADMLAALHPDFSYDLVAWAEFDPEGNRDIERQPAVIAHNLLFPQYRGRNRGDITKADWSDLADAEIDLLTYSTPCQSISRAGLREGLKRDSGTRSAVLWSTERAVAQMRPKVLLQENVRALLDSNNKADFSEWRDLLASMGYVNFLAPSFTRPWASTKRERAMVPGVLNSRDYGIPQSRERVYMVSIREDVLGDAQYEFPKPFPLSKCMLDIIDSEPDDEFIMPDEAVLQFLTINEADSGVVYMATDHRLSDSEIEAARSSASARAQSPAVSDDSPLQMGLFGQECEGLL